MSYKTEEINCKACEGRGYLAGIREFSCKKCLGTGVVRINIEADGGISLKWAGICAIIILVGSLLWWLL